MPRKSDVELADLFAICSGTTAMHLRDKCVKITQSSNMQLLGSYLSFSVAKRNFILYSIFFRIFLDNVEGLMKLCPQSSSKLENARMGDSTVKVKCDPLIITLSVSTVCNYVNNYLHFWCKWVGRVLPITVANHFKRIDCANICVVSLIGGWIKVLSSDGKGLIWMGMTARRIYRADMVSSIYLRKNKDG